MAFVHRATAALWNCYDRLPARLRSRADKQFDLLVENPWHPSLQLKPVGELWSARVTEAYRALAVREGDVFTWF